MMRNAVLAAMAEMVLQVLNGDQLEAAARDTRDQFLDTLQAHGHDVNSFVRSRVLQLFTRIVQQKVSSLQHDKDTQYPTVYRLKKGGIQGQKEVAVSKKSLEFRILLRLVRSSSIKDKDAGLHLRTTLHLNHCERVLLNYSHPIEKFL